MQGALCQCQEPERAIGPLTAVSKPLSTRPTRVGRTFLEEQMNRKLGSYRIPLNDPSKSTWTISPSQDHVVLKDQFSLFMLEEAAAVRFPKGFKHMDFGRPNSRVIQGPLSSHST